MISFKLIENLGRFVVDNGILSLIIGATVGFAFSNVIRSFKINIMDYYIINTLHLGHSSSNIIIFITTICEFFFILLVIYNIYKLFFINIIKKYQNDKVNTSIIQQSIADSLKKIEENTTPK